MRRQVRRFSPQNVCVYFGLLGVSIACAGFVVQPFESKVYFGALGTLIVMMALVALRTYFERLDEMKHRLTIGIVDALETIGTAEFESLKGRSLVRSSPRLYQAFIDADRRFQSMERLLKQHDIEVPKGLKKGSTPLVSNPIEGEESLILTNRTQIKSDRL